MVIDKFHWLPIHSFIDGNAWPASPIFSVVPGHSWPGVKNILSWLLSQFMSGNALPFAGNFSMYLIVFATTFQIQTKYQIQIHAFLWFSIQIQVHKIYVYKYIFKPNPVAYERGNSLLHRSVQSFHSFCRHLAKLAAFSRCTMTLTSRLRCVARAGRTTLLRSPRSRPLMAQQQATLLEVSICTPVISPKFPVCNIDVLEEMKMF